LSAGNNSVQFQTRDQESNRSAGNVPSRQPRGSRRSKGGKFKPVKSAVPAQYLQRQQLPIRVGYTLLSGIRNEPRWLK